jgi:hypothetical protein
MELLLTKTEKAASKPLELKDECDGGLSEPGRNNIEAHPSRSVDPEEELPTEAELLFDIVERVLRKL